MKHTVTLIPGDGIGPEVTKPTLAIIKAAGVNIEWETHLAGASALKKHKTTIPKALLDSFTKNKIALKGPVTTPVGEGFPSVNVELRQTFDLYSNLRPIKNLPGVKARYQNVDLIIVRENTEGRYSGIEHEVVPGVVESLKIITEKASTRISRFAFEYARKNKRKRIHAIHKANIMKLSDGLFLRCSRNVAKEYPEITYGEHIGDHCAIFEAVHGSAPDIAGKNIANPTAVIRSALLMLRHLGEYEAATKIRNALEKVYRTRDKLTRDVGGKAGTSEFADSIIEFMASESGVAPAAETSHA